MLIGEFAYSLRSSLDNLAWQLALLTTDAPNRMTAFPIESECPGAGNRGYNEKVANFPQAALAVVESVQPYHSWPAFKKHPLWQLNKLCNIDKHRSIAIGFIHFQIGIFNVSEAWRYPGAFEHAEVFGVPLAEKDQLELNVDVPGVVFGDPIDRTDGTGDLEIDMDGLHTIYNFVRREVAPKFASFFPLQH
jgi:hypothetical protein